jgi:hypothetical protein
MAGSVLVHGLLYKHHKLDSSYALYVPTSSERGELEVLKQINSFILQVGKPITVSIGKHTFNCIYGANKVAGTPKADIALVSYNEKTKKFEDVCFISHKMGTDASGFQQYSGITNKADGTKTGSISSDMNVIEFLRSLSKIHNLVVNGKERFYRTIDDNKLIGKAIYGPLFGASKFSTDNIHLIGQGDVTLTKSGTKYIMSFSSHTSLSPSVSEFKKGDYTTIIAARYTSGRNYDVGGKTYKGVRVLIMPKKLIGSKAKEI